MFAILSLMTFLSMSDKRAGDTDIADLVIPLLEVVCIVVLYKLVNPKRFQVEDSVGFL